MEPFVKQFFSGLHKEHLRPLGYSKQRFTFSRKMPGYVERFQFQGSRWNSAGDAWQFYLNVGVQFNDLPPRDPAMDFPETHAWSRIAGIVPEAPAEFRLLPNNADSLAVELSTLVANASTRVPSMLDQVRSRCVGGKYSQLRAI